MDDYNVYMFILVSCVMFRYKKREVQKVKNINEVERSFVPAGAETLKDYVEQSQSSGSGSGQPLLVRIPQLSPFSAVLCVVSRGSLTALQPMLNESNITL